MIPSKSEHLPKETVSYAQIRFQDCDPMQHLNNAKYFDYFFNAREDQIPKLYGVNPVDFFKNYQCAWVIYNHKISYLRSALPGEKVTIKTRLIFNDRDTLVTEYLMSDADDLRLKTVLWSTTKYFDLKTQRKTDHQPEVAEFFDNIAFPGVDATDFDRRVKELNEAYRAKK